MKIYTKKGDKGETSLIGIGFYPKDHPRVMAYGAVDELNSVVGIALAEIGEKDISTSLLRIQQELFLVGGELATVEPKSGKSTGWIGAGHVESLEREIDMWEGELPPLKKFILPGGASGAAQLHLARTVCRRAERQVVALSKNESVRPILLQYLNRLSDWFFVLARIINHRAKVQDICWEGPGKP